MSLDAWVGLVATVGTAVMAMVLTIWLEFRKRRNRHDQGDAEGSPPSSQPLTPASRLELVRERQILRCGVINHPPLSSWDHDGALTTFAGYYVELAREVGAREGLAIEFVAMDWGVLSTAFSELHVDIVLSIFETKARLQYADFVACMHKVGVSGVMRPDSVPLSSVSELSDPELRIGVVVGEVGWEFVTHELELPRFQLVQVDSGALRTAFSPLISGDADIAIVDDLTCVDFIKTHPDFQHVFASDSLYMCKNSIMVPRGEADFAEWVDDVFLAARRDPRMTELETLALKETGGWVKKFR